jgi:predicted alpha/beta-fold hydrolase
MSRSFSQFRPAPGLRSGHVQSLISSSALRRRHARKVSRDLRAAEQVVTLDGGNGIRLQGMLSRQPAGRGKGLAALLHGWEGSVHSNYILASGARLFREGFDVFRLNFRDHGDTHHLNPGIFHSCRLDEVVHSLRDLQDRHSDLLVNGSWCLAGFSLGGNFAMRVALQAAMAGLSLGQVVAICPVIDPLNTMIKMENGLRFYERYFERKWGRSLKIKQACFPRLYGAENWYELKSLRARTHYLATEYYGFESSEAYFDGYSIARDRLKPLKVRATVLTSADDPVVPVEDFHHLPDLSNLELIISRYGGHCGFLKDWSLGSIAEDLIAERFLAALADRSEDHD